MANKPYKPDSFTTGGGMTVEFFPPNVIAVQKELLNHPDIQEKLAKLETNDWAIRLAKLAAICGIALHDDYSEEDIDRVCGHIMERLRNRTKDSVDTNRIILPHGVNK